MFKFKRIKDMYVHVIIAIEEIKHDHLIREMLKNARRDGPTMLSKLILPKFKVCAQKRNKTKEKKSRQLSKLQEEKTKDCVMVIYLNDMFDCFYILKIFLKKIYFFCFFN
jgi:hypothetical protein